MTRNQRRCSVVLATLVVVATFEGLPDARGGVGEVCPLSVVGIWKPETTTEANPIFLSFASDGWVSLLSGSAETRAQDFEVLAQVGYRVDASTTPTRIEFRAARGTDVFPPGTSSWEIVEHGDESFTTLSQESGEHTRWVRVQTHRYFLTFAARSGSGEQHGPALAMWTKLDGRRTDFEALGVRLARAATGEAIAVFGRIPQSLAREFAVESGNELDVMLRLELNETEYHRTHAILENWERRLQDPNAPAGDPHRRLMQFLEVVTRSLNQCDHRIDLTGADPSASADSASVGNGGEPVQLIRLIRTLNKTRHVGNDRFPEGWEPPPPM